MFKFVKILIIIMVLMTGLVSASLLSEIGPSIRNIVCDVGVLTQFIGGTFYCESNIELNELNVTTIRDIDTIQFNISYNDGSAEGRLQWNSDDGVPEIGLPGGNVNLQIGLENLRRVKAQETLSNGDVVYACGSSGTRLEVCKADWDSIYTSRAIGVATEDITINQLGYVNAFGYVRDIDSEGQNGNCVDGSAMWLADSGKFTCDTPGEDKYKIVLGVVVKSNAADGIIDVIISTVPRLQGLTFVNSTGLTNHSILQYNDDLDVWGMFESPTFVNLQVEENINSEGYIKVGTISPKIQDNKILSEGGFASYGGYWGKNTGKEPYFKMYSSSATKLVEGSNGRFVDSTNIFCDDTVNLFNESFATRPTKVLTIFNSTYEGAIAEIGAYINSSCIVLEKNPGWDSDFDNYLWDVRTGLKINFNDGEAYKFVIGNDPDSLFKFGIPDGTGVHGVLIGDIVGDDSHTALTIDQDIKSYDGIVGFNMFTESSTGTSGINYDQVAFEINQERVNDSNLHFMIFDVIGQGLNNDIDIFHILGDVDHIIHQGSEDTLTNAYVESVDETYNFTTNGVGATMFEVQNDYVYIGSDVNFTTISFALDTSANKNLLLEYYYCNTSGTYELLSGVTDTTDGMLSSGTITFINPDDRGVCNIEYDGTAFDNTTNVYYIAIKRTLASLQTEPIESLVTIGGSSTLMFLQKDMLKLDGSVGGPVTCNANYAGAWYYDSSAVQLLWCDGSSWQAFASAGDVTIHNSLSGLQGGTATEYYHLTSSEHTIATQEASTSLSGYLSTTDWDTFNNKADTDTTLNMNTSQFIDNTTIKDEYISLVNSATATALAADGGNCVAGSYPLGVDTLGAVQDCTDASTEIDSIVATHTAISAAHQALVTLTGQDYLTLSTQQITAGEIEPDDLASSDFGAFTCDGTTCTLDTTYLENVVEDTTPQLGGNLDTQGYNISDVKRIGYSNGTSDVKVEFWNGTCWVEDYIWGARDAYCP